MELRKDYILERWVYIASARQQRPVEIKSEPVRESKSCFFCEGNESSTPEEIGRVKSGKGWLVRWFANKFPAVQESGSPEVKTDNTFFTFADAVGKHEIIADTPRHGEQLWDLNKEHFAELLKVYFSRISELGKMPSIKYVTVFKNHGSLGGASLSHSHTQVAALAFFPPAVEEEIDASAKYGTCPYCRIIEIEKGSLRRCFENSSFVAFAPYASRFNYEVWVFPKQHISSFSGMNASQVSELAEMMQKILARLKSINTAYNFFFHYSPGLHCHIEVTPRMASWAGFEHSTGAIINTVSPEFAASFYRGEL